MRDPGRIPRSLEKLRALWHAYPDMRLGQLVENLAVSYKLSPPDLFYIEDEDMEAHIDRVLATGWEAARKAT